MGDQPAPRNERFRPSRIVAAALDYQRFVAAAKHVPEKLLPMIQADRCT
jgi:hypothetical protein